MADPDIQKSKHLLKRLNDEMSFLRSLMAQAILVSSNLNRTWAALENVHQENTETERRKDVFMKDT